MTRSLGVLCVLLLVTGGFAAAQETAYTLYSPSGDPADVELYSLELGTGEASPVGPVGFAATALAFDPAGVLFAVDSAADLLLTIDPASGAGSAVGPLGTDVDPGPGLTFDAAGDLWMTAGAAGQAPDGVPGGRMLWSVDPATGAATLVGPLGLSEEGIGLAAQGGVLYGCGLTLVTIDSTTGAATQVAIPELLATLYAMDSRSDGRLWAVGQTVTFTPFPPPASVFTVDPQTGEIALVADISAFGLGPSHWGLAIQGEPGAQEIPALGLPGLALLALLLAGAGIVLPRRS